MAEGKTTSTTSTRMLKSGPSAATTSATTADGLFGKISSVFFDLDNTLIPTRAGDSKACRKLADVLENQFGFTKEESTTSTSSFLKSFRRCPDNSQTSLDSWRTYLWRAALSTRHKHLAEQIYPKWLQLRFRYLALPAEYVQMLRRFRESGYLLALITNGPSNAQWEKVKKLHVSQYFDCVLVSSDLPWEKPNPNIFYAACNFLRVKPTECVMVGDKLTTDIKGGHLANLGATFWLPLNPMETDLSGVEHPPDVILRNLLDMSKYFAFLSDNTNNSSNAMSATAAASSSSTTAAHTSATFNNLQNRRRGSQVSYSATTSTCDSEHHTHAHPHHQHHQHQHPHAQQRPFKSCRRGSLPDIEYMNSEAENSSDSLFS